MARNCYHIKAGAFVAAAINLLVGGLTLGGAIYKVAINKNGRIGLLVIMFLMSLLLIHNGILLIVGIVMVNREYVVLYLVLNCVNWLVCTFVVLKEMSAKMAILSYIGFSVLLIVAWCLEIVVYMFYKKMCKRHLCTEDIEADDKPSRKSLVQ